MQRISGSQQKDRKEREDIFPHLQISASNVTLLVLWHWTNSYGEWMSLFCIKPCQFVTDSQASWLFDYYRKGMSLFYTKPQLIYYSFPSKPSIVSCHVFKEVFSVWALWLCVSSRSGWDISFISHHSLNATEFQISSPLLPWSKKIFAADYFWLI